MSKHLFSNTATRNSRAISLTFIRHNNYVDIICFNRFEEKLLTNQ